MAVASDLLEGSLSYGYDSNPYKISVPDSTQGASEYTALTLKYQGDRYLARKDLKSGALKNNSLQGKRPQSTPKANLLYRLKLDKHIYTNSSSAADSFRLDGQIRWIERFKLAERKASLLFSADIRRERNTYFSQTQRQVAETSDGDLIGNRFSFDAEGLTAELVYYADQQQSWSLLTAITQRSYSEDYSDVGLESLDFNEFKLQPSFRYKAASGTNLRLFVYHKSRHYQGLYNDLETKLSLVEYSLNGYGAVLSKPFSDQINTSVYLSGYFARDNGLGARDLNYQRLSISFNYQLAAGAEFEINSQAYRRGYLDQGDIAVELETGLSGGQRNGLIVEAVYSRPMAWQFLRGMASLRREQENNSTDSLDYHRYLIEIGLQFQL
jgi:hypothetical protein